MQKAKELKIKTAKGQTTKKRFPKILLKATKYENPIEFVRQVRFKANRGLLQRDGKLKYTFRISKYISQLRHEAQIFSKC